MAISEQSLFEEYTYLGSAALPTEEPLSGLGICYRQLDPDYSCLGNGPFWGQYTNNVTSGPEHYESPLSGGISASNLTCVSLSDLYSPSTSDNELDPSLSSMRDPQPQRSIYQTGIDGMQISARTPSSESSSGLDSPSSFLWDIGDLGWTHPAPSPSQEPVAETTLPARPALPDRSSRRSSSPPPSDMSSVLSQRMQPRKRNHQQEVAMHARSNKATEFCGDEDIAENIDDGDDERDEDYSPGAPKRRKDNVARRASKGTSRRTSTSRAPSGRLPRDHHSTMGAQSRMRSAAPRARRSSGVSSATTPATVPAMVAASSSIQGRSSDRTIAASCIPAGLSTTRDDSGIGGSSATSSNRSEEPTHLRCAPCSKSFGRKGDLQRHQQTTKGCPYFNPANAPRCSFPGCGRSFGRLDSCRRHLKTCNFKSLAHPEEL